MKLMQKKNRFNFRYPSLMKTSGRYSKHMYYSQALAPKILSKIYTEGFQVSNRLLSLLIFYGEILVSMNNSRCIFLFMKNNKSSRLPAYRLIYCHIHVNVSAYSFFFFYAALAHIFSLFYCFVFINAIFNSMCTWR